MAAKSKIGAMRERLILIRRHDFVKQLESGLDRCGIEPGMRLLVACSGGADSVALLLGLTGLASLDKWQFDLHAGHVQHHLRDAAEADATFVADLAEQWQLTYHRRDVQPSEQPGNVEANARELRYRALADVAQAIDADAVVTAHHADDQLETMLMRLMRGASVGGMSGIAERARLAGVAVVRPMLWTTHETAEQFCRDVAQPWREDATNADTSRDRTRLRAEVLPVLRAMKPDATIRASATADRARAVHRLTRAWTRRLLERHGERVGQAWCMDREEARTMPAELLRWTLRGMALGQGCPSDRLNEVTIDRIATAARDTSGESRRFELAGGVCIEVAADRIRCTGRS